MPFESIRFQLLETKPDDMWNLTRIVDEEFMVSLAGDASEQEVLLQSGGVGEGMAFSGCGVVGAYRVRGG